MTYLSEGTRAPLSNRLRDELHVGRHRFGGHAEPLAALCLIPAYVGWVGSQFVAFGFILNALTGVDTTLAIVGGAAFVILYTLAGGLWAVSLTDAVQAIVLTIGLAFLLGAIVTAPGGEDVLAQIPAERWRVLPDPGWPERLAWVQAWVVIGLGAIPSQDLLQRVLSARSDTVARASAHGAGLLYLTVGMIPVLLGMAGAVLLPDLANPELVVPRLCLEWLSPIGVMVVLGALLSAIMSSADSALLATASVLAKNILPLVKHEPSAKLSLLVARWSIPACGVIAMVIAMKIKIVFHLMINANILGLAAIIVPFIMGLWWKKANRTGALASMFAGLSAWLLTLFIAPGLPADFIGLATSFVAMLIVTPLTQKFDPPREMQDADGNPVNVVSRLGTLPLFGRSSVRE